MRLYWAQIDNGVVVQTSVSDSLDFGDDWLSENVGGTWIEYWKDGGERKNPAGIGFTYDVERDAFIPPKPFESWVLDEDTCLWEAPVAYPEDGNTYTWDEELQEWTAVENETE